MNPDQEIDAAVNAIYAAIGGQITFASANRIFNKHIRRHNN